MEKATNITTELKDLQSSLADQPRPAGNGFVAPIDYFESLPTRMLAIVKALDLAQSTAELETLSPLLNGISRQMPYHLPAGYFETVEAGAMHAVNKSTVDANEELEVLSPLLGSLKNKNPYQVPPGYFDNVNIPVQTPAQKESAKVVSMGARKWLKYAVAAVTIGIIAMTTVLLTNNSNVDANKNPTAWIQKNLKKVSTEEINSFVQLTDETLPSMDVVAKADKPEEIKKLLQDVSDKELQEFLSEIPTDDAADNNVNDDDILMN